MSLPVPSEIAKNDFSNVIWSTTDLLAESTGISKQTAENIFQLIQEENTLPFIARYRKSMIDHMSPEKLQIVFDSYEQLCKLKKKAINLLRSLQKEGKLDRSLQKSIISAKTLDELNLLSESFKKNSFSDQLKEWGLDNTIKAILLGKPVSFSKFCNNKMKSPEIVKEHIVHGLAIEIQKNPSVLDAVKQLFQNFKNKFHIECHKARKRQSKQDETKNKDLEDKFNLYVDFKMPVNFVKPHQILAINRGEELKVLSVKVIIPEHVLNEIHKFCHKKWENIILIRESVDDAYKRFFQPWFCRQIRKELTAKGIKESIDVFCSNLKKLLLTKPIKNHNIMGIDPGFKHGCKFSIIDSHGNPLSTFVLYPKFSDKNDRDGLKLCQIIKKHNCEVIALGDGTACRETEKWLHLIGVLEKSSLIIVPEQGASIYSCSGEASKEFPNMDPNLISAISLARRAMDPLSELIKVEPKHIGVGMYQHDMPPKLLNEALNNVVINCVSFVGVDLNTASHNLLLKVAGLSDKKAKNILEYRDKKSGFENREELLKVTGIGPITYKQCAGFLRISNGKIKLDNTWIHPESYKLTYKFLQHLKLDKKDIGEENFINNFKLKTTNINLTTFSSTFKCNESELELIIEALSQTPMQDNIRNVKPIYSTKIPSENNLEEGAVLRGIVRNVTTFGVFVDCGIGNHGLIHNSKLGHAAVHPQLGDRVIVSVLPSFVPNKVSLQLIEIIN